MIKVFFLIFSLLSLNISVFAAPKGDELPEIGSTYMLDKTPFKVVGASSSAPFEYTATGDSLQIIVGKIPGTIVFVPEKGQKVRVDPSVPMVWIHEKPHNEFVQNAYLKKNGKDQRHILLEIIR